MPKRARELSAYQIRRLTRPGLHAVGGVDGLYLNVKEGGGRSWSLRLMVGDRRREFGLGGYPTVTLEGARERAREMREQVWRGVDPVAAKRASRDALKAAEAKRMTFDAAATAFLAQKSREFRNAKHTTQWRTTLAMYASPVLGALPVDEIQLAHVVSVLEPIWQTKTESASRLRGRIEAVLGWATVSGYRTGDNPARWKGNLEHVLARPSKVRRRNHYRALHWSDVPAFAKALRARDGIAARALEFALLTAARSGEVRLATWSEMDLDAKLWTIPASRMKAGKAHRVPLSAPAVALLRALPRHGRYVFVAPKGGALSDMSISAVMRRMEVNAVPHGLRSSFKDWCRSSTAYPDEVTELALAHVSTDATRAAYARDELLPQRERLMRDWGRYCTSTPRKSASVTPIRGRHG